MIEGWRRAHPRWDVQIWDDARVEAAGLENAAAFRNAPNWGEKSDIARYEILFRHGGVYVDCDMVCLAPIDPLIEVRLARAAH